ncbi:hypothetical protein Halhy_5093 [Haliscomenobacter hydrossis DSM 1100]|uniref:Uncharacterized protein n=1 Tax=Haliscomenobacter hydrossis (strain ATCC 27775 / DSM 1100 / LMG 10767 / O) TaxID=760192 RepID=F4L3E2_HALH1|nr:hypothetical protein Halhy_5093 [Haliscomenobacter hydrossis DSM 1100]
MTSVLLILRWLRQESNSDTIPYEWLELLKIFFNYFSSYQKEQKLIFYFCQQCT